MGADDSTAMDSAVRLSTQLNKLMFAYEMQVRVKRTMCAAQGATHERVIQTHLMAQQVFHELRIRKNECNFTE